MRGADLIRFLATVFSLRLIFHPSASSQAFTLYVRDQVPDNQTPERINEAFGHSAHELADLCEEMPRPKWVKNASAVMTSLELFPQTSR
jgi:hypothetical protein